MTAADTPNTIDMEYTVTDKPVADVAALRAEITRLHMLESEATMQARRDAERADSNAAECGRLRVRLEKLEQLYQAIYRNGLRHHFLIRTIMDELEKPA